MNNDHKRSTDTTQQDEIEELIAEEQDPKARLTLIVMNRMALALAANTAMTHGLKDQAELMQRSFDAHLDNFADHTAKHDAYERERNTRKDVWTKVIGALQVVIVGVASYTANYIHTMSERVDKVENEQTRRAAYVRVIELAVEKGGVITISQKK